jgi:hypothetical protein
VYKRQIMISAISLLLLILGLHIYWIHSLIKYCEKNARGENACEKISADNSP